MARKISGFGRILNVLLVLLQVVAVVLLLQPLRAGWSSGRPNKPDSYLVMVDASGISHKGDNEDLTGVPDSHDFSRLKDFFAIYPLAYCSGHKDDRSSEFVTDFCSQPIKEYFDQHRLWKVWGVDVAAKYGRIETVPKIISTLSLVAVSLCGISAVTGTIATFCTGLSVVAVALSGIAALGCVALAALCQNFASGFSASVNDLRVSEIAIIDTVKGGTIFIFLWGAAGSAVLAVIFGVVAIFTRKKEDRRYQGMHDDKQPLNPHQSHQRQQSSFVPKPLRLLARRTTGFLEGAVTQRKSVKVTEYTELQGGQVAPVVDTRYEPNRPDPRQRYASPHDSDDEEFIKDAYGRSGR